LNSYASEHCSLFKTKPKQKRYHVFSHT
jgi:hypothetical protein